MGDPMSKANEMGKSIPPPGTFVYSNKQTALQATDDLSETVFHYFGSKGKLKGTGKGFGGPTWSGNCKLIVKLNGSTLFEVQTGSWSSSGTDLSFSETEGAEGDRLVVKVEKGGAGTPLVPFSFFLPIESG